jgi:phage head maturation protease
LQLVRWSHSVRKLYSIRRAGKEHSGIFVDVYVSKGAQDTWEKVLDGTLSGFSIGGNVKKTDNQFNSELDKSIRVIKEYDLTELSLVDNPANQLSNIFSIQKTADGNTFSGIAADVQVENIFYDSSSDEVFLSKESEFKSPTTDKSS